MSKEWVKVFSVDGEQVLFIKDFDNKPTHKIVVSIMLDVGRADLDISFETEDSRDNAFNGLTHHNAKGFMEMIKEELINK